MSVLGISDAASIGMHAAALIAAEPDRPVPSAEIADRLGVSEAHLAKILQRLVHGGLLDSTRGPGGGFRLVNPPSRVSLMQVYEAIEGPFKGAGCLLRRPGCSGDACILGGLVGMVDDKFRDYFANTRLSDLTRVFSRKKPAPQKAPARRRNTREKHK
ncbi:MAG TPA: Rrf2 family transcriptional regulator [Candidatus Brocadiia bacterium]|nr:Rrf2 family transcriptional regulator [Candidatus Brocadiia bacterium]